MRLIDPAHPAATVVGSLVEVKGYGVTGRAEYVTRDLHVGVREDGGGLYEWHVSLILEL